jgi:hypothetical protein
MIANVSPEKNNFQETLSTLRYAWEAKKIKINAPVNLNFFPNNNNSMNPQIENSIKQL